MAAKKKPAKRSATPKGSPVRELRIRQIMKARIEGTFRIGKTLFELAKAWGVTHQCAREYSAEASRRLLEEHTSDETQLLVRVTFERVIEQGFLEGDLKAVNSAATGLMNLCGLAAPKRTELTGKDGGAVELDVEIAGALERVSSRIDRLAAASGAPSPPAGAGADTGGSSGA